MDRDQLMFNPHESTPTEDEMDEVLGNRIRRLIDGCPQCRNDINGHRYCLAASTVIATGYEASAQEFLDLFDGRKWVRLLEFQDWEGAEDNHELYFLRCPGGQMSAAVIFAPFAPELLYELVRLDVVPSEIDLVSALASRDWKFC